MIKCSHCDGTMRIATRTEKDIGLQMVGVVLFIVGLCLLFVFPLGTVAGIALMIGSARMGHKKRRVQKCAACGYFYHI